MSLCGERTAVKFGFQERLAVTLFCRSWGCPACAEDRKRRLIAEIVGGSPSSFLTLTIRRSEASTPAEAARQLSAAWQTLRARLKYYHGWLKLPFFAVFERHVSGWPHLHIFLRCAWISQQELSCWMSHLINSPIVHIRKIDSHGRAAGYAAKYTSKDNVRFGTAKRYWQSPDYDLRPAHQEKIKLPPGFGWERDTRTVQQFAKDWRTLGWIVTQPRPHVAHARAPPGGS